MASEECDGCGGAGKVTVSISRGGKVTYADCPDCRDPRGETAMSAKVRTVLFGELAVAADKAVEFFYNMAIRANRTAGWLIERRDARPGDGPCLGRKYLRPGDGPEDPPPPQAREGHSASEPTMLDIPPSRVRPYADPGNDWWDG